jgi:hypothetical protein
MYRCAIGREGRSTQRTLQIWPAISAYSPVPCDHRMNPTVPVRTDSRLDGSEFAGQHGGDGSDAAVADRPTSPSALDLTDRDDNCGGTAGEYFGDRSGFGVPTPLVDGDPAFMHRNAELGARRRTESRVTPGSSVPVNSGVTNRASAPEP